jgi:hypothetical protein
MLWPPGSLVDASDSTIISDAARNLVVEVRGWGCVLCLKGLL